MSIITTIEEVKAIIPLAASSSENFLPSFDLAVSEQLIPIIGQELYDALETAYEGETLSDIQKKLLTKCHAVIVPFAYVEELPLRQVNIGDTGLNVIENQESRKAFKWEFYQLLEKLYKRGYAAQEALIVFLKQNKGSFPEWDDADYNTTGCAIIRDGSDLRGIISLQEPHRCYMMLKGIIAAIVEETIKPSISEAYYEVLNASIIADTLTEQEEKLLPKLRMSLCRLAMAKAGTELNVKFSANGFTIVYEPKDVHEDGRTNAGDSQIARFITQHLESGRALLEQAIAYMNKQASEEVFAEFYASDCYKDPTIKLSPPDNSGYKGLFRL